jgi:hypothetical protein
MKLLILLIHPLFRPIWVDILDHVLLKNRYLLLIGAGLLVGCAVLPTLRHQRSAAVEIPEQAW